MFQSFSCISFSISLPSTLTLFRVFISVTGESSGYIFSTKGLLSARLKNHDELVQVAVVPQKLLHHCFHSACVPCPAASRPDTGELVGERVPVCMCILFFDSCKCDCKCTSNVVFKRCRKTTCSINLPTTKKPQILFILFIYFFATVQAKHQHESI